MVGSSGKDRLRVLYSHQHDGRGLVSLANHLHDESLLSPARYIEMIILFANDKYPTQVYPGVTGAMLIQNMGLVSHRPSPCLPCES